MTSPVAVHDEGRKVALRALDVEALKEILFPSDTRSFARHQYVECAMHLMNYKSPLRNLRSFPGERSLAKKWKNRPPITLAKAQEPQRSWVWEDVD